jgi:hypothetical protein
VKGTTGSTSLELVDASGNLVALSTSGKGVDAVISDLVAPTTGTYYAVVTGATGVTYDLVVTRGADFGLHGDSFANAQPLNGVSTVLGSILPDTGSLYVLDDLLYSANNLIYPTNPATGVFTGPAIAAPGPALDNPFGLNLAFDGTDLYYNYGANFGDNTIYKLDPSNGDVLASGIPAGVPSLGGLAYYNGELYGVTAVDPTIYVIDPNTFQLVNTIQSGLGSGNYVEGLTAPITTTGYAQDIAYANGQLIVSDSVFLGPGGGLLDYFDPTTLAPIQQLPVATQGYVSGLGGDGLGGTNADWYQFNVNAGDSLAITTTTPGG